jgi:hypothetical protein
MEKNKRQETIAKRQAKDKAALLDKFRRMPILQIALDQTRISRSTYYKWRDDDEQFKTDAEEAIAEGEEFITELSESKLLSLINKEHFPAIHLWLRSHHSKYANKLELSGSVKQPRDEMNEEEFDMFAQAHSLSGFDLPQDLEIKNQTNPVNYVTGKF